VQEKRIDGEKTPRFAFSLNNPFEKAIFKVGAIDGKSLRISVQGPEAVEVIMDKDGRVLHARGYKVFRTNQPGVPDEWIVVWDKIGPTRIDYEYKYIYLDGVGELGYQMVGKKTANTNTGKVEVETVFSYEIPEGNVIQIGKDETVVVRAGTAKVVTNEVTAKGTPNEKRMTYINYLFTREELENMRAIARGFYGRDLFVDDKTDQRLINELVNYRTLLGMSIEEFSRDKLDEKGNVIEESMATKLGRLKEIPSLSVQPDEDYSGLRKRDVLIHLAYQLHLMKNGSALQSKDCEKISRRLIDNFIASNTRYRFHIDYVNPNEIGKWFWVFIGNPQKAGLNTVDAFNKYFDAFDRLSQDKDANRYFSLANKLSGMEKTSLSGEKGLNIAEKLTSSWAIEIAAGKKSYEDIIAEIRKYTKDLERADESVRQAEETLPAKMKEEVDKIEKERFKPAEEEAPKTKAPEKPAATGKGIINKAAKAALLLFLTAVGMSYFANPASASDGTGMVSSFLTNPLSTNMVFVYCLSAIAAVIILFAAWRLWATHPKAAVPAPAAQAPVAAGQQVQPVAAQPAVPELSTAPQSTKERLDDIAKKCNRLIGDVNDDLTLLQIYRNADEVSRQQGKLKADKDKLKNSVLAELRKAGVTTEDLLAATGRPNAKSLGLLDIALVISDGEFEVFKKAVNINGGWNDRQGLAKNICDSRYSIGWIRKNALVSHLAAMGVTVDMIMERLRDKPDKLRDKARANNIKTSEVCIMDLNPRDILGLLTNDEKTQLKGNLLTSLNAISVSGESMIERVREDKALARKILKDTGKEEAAKEHGLEVITMADVSVEQLWDFVRYDELYKLKGITDTTEYRFKRLDAQLDGAKWETLTRWLTGRSTSLKKLPGIFIGGLSVFLLLYPMLSASDIPYIDAVALMLYGTVGIFITLFLVERAWLKSLIMWPGKKDADERALQLKIADKMDAAASELEALVAELPSYVKEGIPTHAAIDWDEKVVMTEPGYNKFDDAQRSVDAALDLIDGIRNSYTNDDVNVFIVLANKNSLSYNLKKEIRKEAARRRSAIAEGRPSPALTGNDRASLHDRLLAVEKEAWAGTTSKA